VFAKEQIARRYGTRGTGFAVVVDIHAATFDVFSRLAFGGAKTGMDE
jgi:hypothetical protein